MKGLARFAHTWHESMYAVLARRVLRHLDAPCRTCGHCCLCLRRGWLAVHTHPAAVSAVLERLCAAARAEREGMETCFLVADYALAERNLHLPAAGLRFLGESLSRHGREWAAFMHTGGLEGALQRTGVCPVQRMSIGCGLLTVIRCREDQIFGGAVSTAPGKSAVMPQSPPQQHVG